jgi:hypothetical protein
MALRVGLARQQENPNKSFLLTLQLMENVSKSSYNASILPKFLQQGPKRRRNIGIPSGAGIIGTEP